jgi:LemA protein
MSAYPFGRFALAAIIVIVVIVVLVILFFVLAFNGAVRLRNRVDSAWSQISVQLQRRHDLIPNLLETVKGYAAHERQTLEAVTAARTSAVQAQQAGPAQQAQAENVLSGALRQLFALSENYPDLKANQNFLSLQEELTSTEDRIAYARQFYNDSVMKYDNKIQSIPSNLIAGMFGFTSREYFKADDTATEVPRVQF